MARISADVVGVVALESPCMYDIKGVKDGEYLMDDSDYGIPILNVYSDAGYSHLSEWKQYRNNAKFLESENENYENIYYEGIGHMGLCDLSLDSPVLARILDQKKSDVKPVEQLKRLNADCLDFLQRLSAGNDRPSKKTGFTVPVIWRMPQMKKKIQNPIAMLCFGLLLGFISRLLDIFTTNPGEIFSQMAVWILLGTLISVYSRTAKKAMVNVPAFCLGMLFTYYLTAVLSRGVYSTGYIIGWTVFALFSPFMAFLAWYAKERGVLPKIVGAGIIAVSVLSSVLLFGRFRIYDLVIDGALFFFLFIKKVER